MKKTIFVLLLIIFNSHSSDIIDGIAAVVGDSLVLESEVEAYVQTSIQEEGYNPDRLALDILKEKALDDIIRGKILIVHAQNDTNIDINPVQVENQLDKRISMILKRNGNLDIETFKEQLENEMGMPYKKFRQQLRSQIKSNMIKQQVQSLYIGNVNVSRAKVDEFYEEYKDSLPTMGKSILLSRIHIENEVSEEVKRETYKEISRIKKKIKEPEDFTKVAKRYSEGPNAEQGGELGFIEKGSLGNIKMEEIIFSLRPGEVSNIFSTENGFRIVYVDKILKGKSLVHQIFIPYKQDKNQFEKVKKRLATITENDTVSKEKFNEYVQKLSSDKISKSNNGLVGWKPVNTLDESIKDAFSDLKKGAVSDVVEIDDGYAVYRIDDTVENRKISPEYEWKSLKRLTEQRIQYEKMNELIEDWKKDLYIKKML